MQGKATGEAWVQLLLAKDYKDLDFAERATILAALTHLTLDGPTLRNTLEARQEEASRVRKQMWEEARVCHLTPSTGRPHPRPYPRKSCTVQLVDCLHCKLADACHSESLGEFSVPQHCLAFFRLQA